MNYRFLWAGWAKKRPVDRSDFFFFLFFFSHKLECTGEKDNFFSPLGRWTGNNFSFEDGLRGPGGISLIFGAWTGVRLQFNDLIRGGKGTAGASSNPL